MAILRVKSGHNKGKLFENRLSPDKGLSHVSNAKLLRLHAVATEIKERFTTRDNLINDLLKTAKREKDEGLRAKLESWPLPRLWDHYKSVSKKKK